MDDKWIEDIIDFVTKHENMRLRQDYAKLQKELSELKASLSLNAMRVLCGFAPMRGDVEAVPNSDEIEEPINLVFQGSENSPDLVFVEAETDCGNSINVGRWIKKDNNQHILRISTTKRMKTEEEKVVEQMCKDSGVGFRMGEHGKAEDFFAKLVKSGWRKS
jgi:hypothetical protein